MPKLAPGPLWAAFVRSLFLCGAAYLLLIVVATIWDVIARNTALPAPVWLGTFVEFGLPISTMLAAPALVRERGHVAMELIDSALNEPMRRRLILFTDLVAAAVSLVVAWYAWLGGHDAWSRSEVVILSVDVPRWWLYAMLVAGFTLCAIEFLRHAVLAVMGRNQEDGVEST